MDEFSSEQQICGSMSLNLNLTSTVVTETEPILLVIVTLVLQQARWQANYWIFCLFNSHCCKYVIAIAMHFSWLETDNF